jgi:hypothetical protein
MAYKIDVDIELLNEAQSFEQFRTKTRQEIVTHALEEYIWRRSLPDPPSVQGPLNVEDPVAYVEGIKKNSVRQDTGAERFFDFKKQGEEATV